MFSSPRIIDRGVAESNHEAQFLALGAAARRAGEHYGVNPPAERATVERPATGARHSV